MSSNRTCGLAGCAWLNFRLARQPPRVVEGAQNRSRSRHQRPDLLDPAVPSMTPLIKWDRRLLAFDVTVDT